MSKPVTMYRCLACGKANTPWALERFGCCVQCGGVRVRPTNLSWWETFKTLFSPAYWRSR